MTKSEYEDIMLKHRAEFEKVWFQIIKDTNLFIESNEKKEVTKIVERFADDLSLSGAWLHDSLKEINHHSKKSISFKIQKTLGYNLN